MAKDRKKLLHIHSSVADKQPTAASLEVGEIAVNNAKDQEFLSIKNSNDKVVRFSSDEQIVTIMEKKGVIPYSGTVDNVHLDTNRSNIEIKLNQVVASATTKHDKVNGAKDIDGDLVNPTTDGGITDGAGFAIDMSQYAMIGANPSFSSVTTTDGATLKGDKIIISGGTLSSTTTGNTVIKGGEGAKLILSGQNATLNGNGVALSGHAGAIVEAYGNVRVESINYGLDLKGKSGITISTSGDTMMDSSGNTCIDSESDANFYGRENTNIGVSCGGEITQKVRVEGDNVIIDATTNNVGITAYNDIDVSSENNININANNDVCIGGGNNVSLFGVEETNIGVNCGGFMNSSVINIKGNNINIDGDSYFSGKTYFNNTCTAITSNELSDAFCELADKMTPKTLALEYGQTCNESGSVDYNTTEAKTITIPSTIAHVTCGDIVDRNAGTSGAVITSNARSTTINSSGTTTLNAGINKTSSLELDNSNARLGGSGTTILGAYGYSQSGIEVGNSVYVQSKDSVYVQSKNVDISSNSGMTVSSIENLNVGSVNGRTSVSGFNGVDIDGYVGGVTIKGQGVGLHGNEHHMSSRYKTCIDSSGETRVYGAEETVVGKSCDNKVSSATTVEGGEGSKLTLSGQTAMLRANDKVVMYAGSSGSITTKNLGQGLGGVVVSAYAFSADTYNTKFKSLGGINLTTTGETNITSNPGIINISCSSGGFGDGHINISGETINISGESINAYSSGNTLINSKGETSIVSSSGITASTSDDIYIQTTSNDADKKIVLRKGSFSVQKNVSWDGETFDVDGIIDAKKGLTKSIKFVSGLAFDVQGDNPYNGSGNTIVTIPIGGGGGGGIDLSAATITYGDTCNLSGIVSYGNTGWTVPSTISNVTCGDIVDTNHNIRINAASLGSHTSGNTYIESSGHTTIESVNSNTNITSNNGGISIRSISGNTNIVAEKGGGVGIKSENSGTYLTTSGGNITIHSYSDGVSGKGQTTLWSEGDTTIRSDERLNIYTRNVSGQTSGDTQLSIKSDGLIVLDSSGLTKITSRATNGDAKSVTWNGANLSVEGTITASGAIYSSDKNLKENIGFIDGIKSERVARIPLRKFNFKDDETKRITYGVIAQEVLDSGISELVHKKEDETLGVDYTSFLILRLSHLEREMGYMNRTIFDLMKKVSNLEKQLNNNNEDSDKK